ncbi:MAG: hypothetical protein QOH06_941 [Acidobacteriota bacterium]|jgi:hypothetical protein|nr:hypothetical protein [Acidobacteriota bacterium]
MCCGSQRRQEFLPKNRQSQPGALLTIGFEYVGTTGLTVVGPVTGKRYRFDNYGSRAAIDLRDAPSMAAVPHLRRV